MRHHFCTHHFMRTCLLLLFALVIGSTGLHAQFNYVPDPSFESDTLAPPIQKYNWNHYTDWRKDSASRIRNSEKYLTRDWFQPTKGTPDYLNSKQSWFIGWKTKTARTGDGRMGIITGLSENSLMNWMYTKNTYSEYFECRLNNPLEAGKTYCVRYFVALDKKSNFCSKGFGAAVSVDSFYYGQSTCLDRSEAQLIAENDHYITSNEGWAMICGTFVARGGEKFLTIGNFSGESPVRVHKADKSQHGSIRVSPLNKYAYYYIDDVSLLEVTPEQPACSPPRDSTLSDHLVFMIDASGSMQTKGYLDEAKEAIISIAYSMPPNNRITVIAYSDVATVVADQIKASDTANLRKGLNSIRSGGGTNASVAFRDAYDLIHKYNRPGTSSKVILLTDGKIYIGKKQKQEVVDAAEKENITFSVIFFGEKVPDDVLEFAESAGGHGQSVTEESVETTLRNETTAQSKDTPYGARKASKIFWYELLTKVVLPAIVLLPILSAFRVI
jgi:von Willebrand factor type A domain